jgi:hypothetical protein
MGRRERCVLVIGEDAELATALRDRLDRAYVTVLDARPGEELDAIRGCSPWPWLVVGAGAGPGAAVFAELARSPILVVWRVPAPLGLPAHAVTATSFSSLVGAVQAALHATVAGMRLAIGGGVEMPGGAHVANAALEALVSSHPRPLAVRRQLAQSAARALELHGVGLAPRPAPAGDAMVLAPMAAG